RAAGAARRGRDPAALGGGAQGDGRAAHREGRLLAGGIPLPREALKRRPWMPPRKRLGQLLTELKVIDEHQLQSALGHQKQWGGKIGAIVVEKGFCSEDQLVAVLSQHLGIATVKLES